MRLRLFPRPAFFSAPSTLLDARCTRTNQLLLAIGNAVQLSFVEFHFCQHVGHTLILLIESVSFD